VQVINKEGTERSLALTDFFLVPERDVQREHVLARDEILTTIIVPRLPEGAGSAYLNLKEKQSFDWPLVEAAVVLHLVGQTVKDARVVLGSVAPVPLRSAAAEKVLIDSSVDTATATKAGEAAAEGAIPLAANAYKVELLAELVRRAVLKAAGKLPAAEEVMAI
jgi:xanthine dehydrogenase YagS FAD-binding subunit